MNVQAYITGFVEKLAEYRQYPSLPTAWPQMPAAGNLLVNFLNNKLMSRSSALQQLSRLLGQLRPVGRWK